MDRHGVVLPFRHPRAESALKPSLAALPRTEDEIVGRMWRRVWVSTGAACAALSVAGHLCADDVGRFLVCGAGVMIAHGAAIVLAVVAASRR